MSNLLDPNIQYEKVKEQVVNLLIDYDQAVRNKHQGVIYLAEQLDSKRPISMQQLKQRDPNDTLTQHLYFTCPIFRTTVDRITGYILSESQRKPNEQPNTGEELLR